MVRIELFYRELDMALAPSLPSGLCSNVTSVRPFLTPSYNSIPIFTLSVSFSALFSSSIPDTVYLFTLFPQPEGEQLESCHFLPCYMTSTLKAPARSVYPVKDLIRLPISPSTHPNISPSFSKCQPQSRHRDGCCVMGERQT